MYIYDFLQSLNYLKGNEYPNSIGFYPSKEKVIYYGYVDRQNIKNNNFDKEGNIFLGYSKLNDPDTIRYVNVDEYMDYINLLEKEPIKIKQSKIYDIEIALHEAIWLFDELSKLARLDHPFIDTDIQYGVRVIDAIYKEYNPNTKQLILASFDGNPVQKDLFEAQFAFFVKKYCIFKLNLNATDKHILRTPEHFNQKIHNAVNNYVDALDDTEKKEWYKKRINPDFDSFIQQIQLLQKDDLFKLNCFLNNNNI